MPFQERQQRLQTLTEAERDELAFLWSFWARPEQLLPAGDWQTWLLLAGRGFGKTRVGAEAVRIWVRSFRHVNIIGPTAETIHADLITGPSGILAVCPRRERPRYVKHEALYWPNGARSLLLSAEEPERIRGKNSEKLWCDELAAWQYAGAAWDQAQLGLRLGDNPQAVVTTTPRPTPIIRQLLKASTTLVTRGSTYDNRANLAPQFLDKIIRKYEGTRLGRQELNAELLDDNPRALWQRDNIDRLRVTQAPTLRRIVVGLDPNAKNRDRAELARSNDVLDEAGIVVAGVDDHDQFYVLADRSIDAGPNEWAGAAVKAYRDFSADRVIGEVNNGGDMIEMTIRAVPDAQNVPYEAVTATRGKAIRAEPISALYEQGRVHHVGFFPQLEDEMCDFDPITTTKSPNRMDALVWALTKLSDADGRAVLDYYRQQAAAFASPAIAQTKTQVMTGPGLQFPDPRST